MKLEDTVDLLLPFPLTLKLLPWSDMKAGPSALWSPGSWQVESELFGEEKVPTCF